MKAPMSPGRRRHRRKASEMSHLESHNGTSEGYAYQNACPKLHGVRGGRSVAGRVNKRGNIIRCRQVITDQAGLSVCLVHGCKARDPDAFDKHQQHHVHRNNNTEAMLRPFQQLLSAESSSFRCQDGHMWVSGNGGENCGQRPGRSYISRAAQLCILFEQWRRRVIRDGRW